jgi:hypothetical protein
MTGDEPAGAVRSLRRPPALPDEQLALIDQLVGRAEKAEGYWIADVFVKLAAEDRLSDEASTAWRLLAELMRMHFRPQDPNEPFGPVMTRADGSRSLIPLDLQANEIVFLRAALDRVTDCEVRARLADTLWLVTRDAAHAREAIRAYLASSERLEDPQQWPPATERLQRAARLARSLGKDDPLLTETLDKVLERIRIYRGRDPLFFTCQLAELLHEFRFGDATELAGYTLAGAEGARAEPDFNRARQYYEISAKMLARARDREGFARARMKPSSRKRNSTRPTVTS